MNKIELRNHLRARRQSLLTTERHLAAESASQLLTSHLLFATNTRIGCYLANDNELDLMPLIKKIWATKKKCYLPLLSSPLKNQLEFASFKSEDDLQLNQFHILEPTKKSDIQTEELDLVLVPLVAFDLQGNRLGMGGGFYDRTFAFLLDKKPHRTQYVGVGYEIQQVDALIPDNWDVPLQGILTEKRLLIFS